MQLLRLAWALTAAAVCFLFLLVIHNQILREGQLAAGTCEIVTLDRDSSQPRRTIARQTARCACRKGQIAGTTRARPACVDAVSCSVRLLPPQLNTLLFITPSFLSVGQSGSHNMQMSL
ncbi:chemokine-like protein TAFA-5 isoform X3 [Micropterus dolomieu]|uniref:chemokine-like protein TAFA-5 isoform X3 n=1 Tax=Micropterus dolomieu TaxID=147949 RepID=UPI001E8CD010|nr:chemokine-like protein TAFA-5 isoform X3 [Micropterus dolomieu]